MRKVSILLATTLLLALAVGCSANEPPRRRALPYWMQRGPLGRESEAVMEESLPAPDSAQPDSAGDADPYASFEAYWTSRRQLHYGGNDGRANWRRKRRKVPADTGLLKYMCFDKGSEAWQTALETGQVTMEGFANLNADFNENAGVAMLVTETDSAPLFAWLGQPVTR